MDKKEPTQTINEILGNTFYVPAYQRGYRWSEREVKALLDDIWEFANNKNSENDFYCLQPLMLKKRDNGYNVVDGQQRLTTLYLLLQYLEVEKLFTLMYDSRNSLTAILQKKLSDEQDAKESADNYCVFQARNEITHWFNAHKKEDKKTFCKTLLNQVQLIWYENDTKSEQESFDHLNRGKIPLTSAELLKGAMLLSTDLSNEDKALLGSEWDGIEHFLQKPEVWGFISKDMDKTLGRIELLFEIYLYIKDSRLYHLYSIKTETPWVYDGIMKLIELKNEENLSTLWQDIKSYARQIEYLYNDTRCYHYIGFLMYQDSSVTEILKEIANQKKSDIKDTLEKKIQNIFQKHDVTQQNFTQKSYEEPKDKKQIENLLLLFNVLTCLTGPAKERFPFYLYAKYIWSLEHILAQHSQKLKKPADMDDKEWYKEQLDILQDEIDFFTETKHPEEKKSAIAWDAKIKELYQIITDNPGTDVDTNQLETLKKEIDEKTPIHYIYNLALLDKASNSSLSNHVFSQKVDQIKQFCQDSTKFIPPATQNVFLKFYSKKVKKTEKWTQADRIAYEKILGSTLAPFLPKGE
ncbi:DUF262 domain-containing protein [Candidatus Avelusimicrobium fimicolum]|uniref:DUF262 domain-containing protein n=1 Tax=Candidatus Avelusimicrobium fimicolum TaxID=3416216 RepID=UPI003D0F00CC